MAIYNIFDFNDSAQQVQQPDFFEQSYDDYLQREGRKIRETSERGQFFSALAARFFFLLLLIADLVWSLYSITLVVFKLTFSLISLFKIAKLNESLALSWLSFKRSLVCAIALFVAIFAPALGIMFSCMYFLMYDKNGVDEVVPASLREQFKDFLPTEWF